MAITTFFRLEELPVELLQRVCSFLDDASLSAFSLSNRRCHTAALFRLYRTIRINILDVKQMQQEIQQWQELLTRNSAHLHVQKLEIDRGLGESEDQKRVRRVIYWHDGYGPEADDLRLFSEDYMSLIYAPYDRVAAVSTLDDWKPLVGLIEQLRGLKCLVYGNPPIAYTIPQCVLKALQKLASNVRLHMDNLAFRYDPVFPQLGGYPHTDRPSRTIIPFLSSAALKLDAWLGANDFGYDANHASEKYYRENLDMLDVILQDAPNLQDLHIWWLVPHTVRLLQRDGRDGYAPSSSQYDGYGRPRLAALNTLNIRALAAINVAFLEYWASRTDFAKLKVLKLESAVAPEAMMWLDSHCAFNSLESLVLHEGDGPHSSRTMDADSMCHNYLVKFLQKLKPLTRLRLHYQLTCDIFVAILSQHGKSLRQLWLEHKRWRGGDFVVNADMARVLRDNCTLLEDLQIPVERSGGNRLEVDLYKTLGSISTLRALFMVLYAPTPNFGRYKINGYASEPAWDVFDRQPYTCSIPSGFGADQLVSCGSVRDAFANNAMDFDLARAIFEVISAYKPPDSIALEVLNLQTSTSLHKSPFSYGKCLGNILDNISRDFCLERDARDTHRDEVSVRCVNQDSIERQNYYFVSATDIEDDALIAIYCRLWPQTAEDLQNPLWWRDNWHSFPLTITREEVDKALQTSNHQALKFQLVTD